MLPQVWLLVINITFPHCCLKCLAESVYSGFIGSPVEYLD